MAVATTQFTISPDDGWVEIATNPASLIIKPDEASSWRLAVTTGAAPAAGAQASGNVTFTGVPGNNETVTVGSVVYTFKTALTPAANEVLRGANLTEQATNLAAAINAGAGAGTLYGTGTVANPAALASNALGVVTIGARAPGVAGNTIALVDAAANMTVSGATLTGGVDTIYGVLFQSGRDGDPLAVDLGGFTGKAYIKAQQTIAHFQVLQDVGPGSTVTASISGTVQAVGNVAAGVADAGNPVKVGGKYNAVDVTLADGQRGDLQLTSDGRIKTEVVPVRSDAISGSNTLTLGGTAQQFMAANASRKGWAIQNQSTDYIYVRSRGAGGATNATQDQNSVRIAPGQMYIPPYTSVNAQSVIGPTTGQAFWAREW